jgi:hypothetical protein
VRFTLSLSSLSPFSLSFPSSFFVPSILFLIRADMPPICSTCAGRTSGGSQACHRNPVMCAKCCRNNGGCGQHLAPMAAAQAPPPQQAQVQPQQPHQPQQLQPQLAPPLHAAQPVQAAAAHQQPAAALQQPDPPAAPSSQLTALLQQIAALLPALAAGAQAPPPPPPAALPAQPAPIVPPPAALQPAPPAPAVLLQAAPLIQPAALAQQPGPFAQPGPPVQQQLAQQPAGPVAINGLPPMPPGLWPLQPPPMPPASHLAAYPPPIGNVGPAQLLSQAQSAAPVSSQHTHSLAATQLLCSNGVLQASGSGHVDLHLRHAGSLASDAYPCDPSTAGTRLSRMPLGILPVNPEKTGKAPTTAEDLHAVLTYWIRNQPELQQDGQRQAYEDYVSKTTGFAKDYGLGISLAYHAEAVKAMLHQPFPLYDPYLHGSSFQAAYQTLVHGKPLLSAAAPRAAFRRGRSGKATFVASDSASGKKRKSSSSSSPQAECSVAGHSGHLNADCRWQKLKKQQSKKKAKTSRSSAAGGTAAAAPATSDSDD